MCGYGACVWGGRCGLVVFGSWLRGWQLVGVAMLGGGVRLGGGV